MFWFSRRNLNRKIHNVLLMFSATEQDISNLQSIILAMDDRITNIEQHHYYSNTTMVRE